VRREFQGRKVRGFRVGRRNPFTLQGLVDGQSNTHLFVSVVAPNDALSGNPFYPVTLIDDQDARGTVVWAERRNQACSRVPYSLSVQIF
jgi:hypothetical protein